MKDRQFASAQILRQTEPYHFQRARPRLSNYPRASQPNTSQPNQLTPTDINQRSNSTLDYYNLMQKQYLNRHKAAASITNLALGRK